MMKAWLLDEMFPFHRAALMVEGTQGEWGAGDSIAEEEELPPAPAVWRVALRELCRTRRRARSRRRTERSFFRRWRHAVHRLRSTGIPGAGLRIGRRGGLGLDGTRLRRWTFGGSAVHGCDCASRVRALAGPGCVGARAGIRGTSRGQSGPEGHARDPRQAGHVGDARRSAQREWAVTERAATFRVTDVSFARGAGAQGGEHVPPFEPTLQSRRAYSSA